MSPITFLILLVTLYAFAIVLISGMARWMNGNPKRAIIFFTLGFFLNPAPWITLIKLCVEPR